MGQVTSRHTVYSLSLDFNCALCCATNVQQILGLNWTLEFQSVWSMKLNEDRMGLGSRGGDSAFTITKMTGLWENGTCGSSSYLRP